MFEYGYEAVKHMTDRRSIRNFIDKKIPDEDLKLILEAGLKAATGGNLQPYSIIVERDKEKNKALSKMCGGQPFIEHADTNLIFVFDWYKYSIYAKQKNAPFNNRKIYMHFLIAIEDVMCAAQTIETAAHMLGIGSCYVGSSNSCGKEIIDAYGMPQLTYPVVILSLGYAAEKLPPKAPKMPYDMMVFEGKYRQFTEEEIYEGFEAKYAGKILELPKKEEFLEERLAQFKNALLTTYDEEKVNEIVEQARKDGFINETQRRFGLHYRADVMYTGGKEIIKMMKDQGLENFMAAGEIYNEEK